MGIIEELNVSNSKINTALQATTTAGKMKMVQMLLDGWADVDAKGDF